MTDDGLVYPAPSLVVGLGRFGLAVLERLGEDWQQLRLSGADLSLKNLRLFWIRSQDERKDDWRERELGKLRIAHYVGGDDMPSIVLDFAILRALGLIRYRHSRYQVAVPRDHGPVRASDLQLASEGSRRKDDERLVRRRYFDWQDLDPDPLLAAETLRRRAERQGTLQLFIAPLINRIRQGHSPTVLLATIMRCRSLAEGRDPSPWRWLSDLVEPQSPGPSAGGVPQRGVIPGHSIRRILEDPETDYGAHDRLLDEIAPSPLEEAEAPKGSWPYREDSIVLPPPFVPQPGDPDTPIDALRLLGEDWQTTGWATDFTERSEAPYKPLAVSRFRLGLFDHALERSEADEEFQGCLEDRLRHLARFLYRGLVRLWVDLDREQVEERSPMPHQRRSESTDEAIQQSLQIMKEMVVRPLKEDREAAPDAPRLSALEGSPHQLADRPTRFLRSLRLEADSHLWEENALERRLAALGQADEVKQARRRPLMREVILSGGGPVLEAAGEDDAADPAGSLALRKALNEEARDLLDFSFLPTYRKRPTRTPPRLTVYVVGDMSEPFTRIKMTEVLRDVHSELLRSFSSIFELHREGFDRALSIVPILWMPHPADPFGGAPLEETRLEEAAIIDSVHRVRRWVEAVLPSARRRVSQIFINGRVTDTAVLTLRDSIRQTRDFLAFQIRNDLSRDDWLRRTAVGPGGDDFFASFACCEIEFPAERAREYLANRLARECLYQLSKKSAWKGSEATELPTPQSADELNREARIALRLLVDEESRTLENKIAKALTKSGPLSNCVSQLEVLRIFDDRFESDIWRDISHLWQRLTQRRGRMDDLVDKLRHRTTQQLKNALPEIRRHADDEIQQTSARGLTAVLARLQDRRREAFQLLRATEEERRRGESVCQRHTIPRRHDLARARQEVVAAAERKPDCGPQRLGLMAWLLLMPAIGKPLSGLLLPFLGGLAPWVAAGLLILTAGGCLWVHRRWRHRELLRKIREMANAVRRLVAGDDGEIAAQPSSLRSFLETRLRLTTALARRGYALHVYEQAATDEGLGQRLRESVDVQNLAMVRRAEALGVRPAPPGTDERDDLRNLFVVRAGGQIEQLIDPGNLVDYYGSRVRQGEEPLIDFLSQVGGVREWRKAACLSDSRKVMRFGRSFFAPVANTPITELDYFADAVGKQLREFVNRHYSNLGFGAKFLGYEGLDPDGVRLVADAALVADQALLTAYERAEDQAEDQARREDRPQVRPRTLMRLCYPIRPNAAYMFSMVQGVRAHSIRNLRRFESFHDRPDTGHRHPPAVHHLTGYRSWADRLYRNVNGASTPGRQQTNPEAETPGRKATE
ncbi:MAG: hypothetical protein AAF481_13540 [Acidobacteriota bacterium]